MVGTVITINVVVNIIQLEHLYKYLIKNKSVVFPLFYLNFLHIVPWQSLGLVILLISMISFLFFFNK